MNRAIDNSLVSQLTASIREDLGARHISEAIDKLDILMQYSQDSQIRADYEELRANYSAMLAFLTHGGSDANRFRVQSGITRQAWTILLRTRRAIRLQTSDDTYTRTATRLAQEMTDTTSLIRQWSHTLPSEERFTLMDSLFDLLWTSPLWNQDDTSLWRDFIMRQDAMVQQHLAGALFLAVWEYPDPEKLSLLTLLAESSDKRTRTMAGTALVFIGQQHGHDLEMLAGCWPGTLCATKLPLVASVQMEFALILASKVDTDREQQEIEAIPHTSGAQAILEALKIKMKYVRKRLSLGYDPNLMRMSTLHSCKFLSVCSHWFLPFDSTHPLAQSLAVGSDGTENVALTKMTQVSADCDIDKYSMCELINGNKNLAQSITEQFRMSGIVPQEVTLPDMTLRHTVQNLYRFFTQSPVCHDVANPFKSFHLLAEQKRFRAQDSEEVFLSCASTLLDAGEYDATARLLDSMVSQYGASARLLCLRGRCHEHASDYPKAYRCYTQATFLEEHDLELALHMQHCCAMLGKREEMYTWLDKVIELHTSDDTYLRIKARELMQDHRWADALKVYYHLAYDTPTDKEATMAIARCEMMQGNTAAAQKYLEKTLDIQGTPDWKTHMLSAHLCFAQGAWPKAKTYYVAAAERFFRDGVGVYADFLKCYEDDRALLRANGIDDNDASLMRDALWLALIHGQ